MQCTINQVTQGLMERMYEAYDVFKNFFGEEYVDLTGLDNIRNIYANSIISNLKCIDGGDVSGDDRRYEVSEDFLQDMTKEYSTLKSTVYVWFPNVTVTNENRRSINIKDLYAKVEIQVDGRIPYENTGFLLNRATYTKSQFYSNYLHSHIPGIPKDNFTHFQRPCLGNGPIKETINTLKNEYGEVEWMLFCQELSMYVTVESVTGGPYHYLERVGTMRELEDYKDYDFTMANLTHFSYVYNKDDLRNFIKYYLEHGHLSISYRNRHYTCGMSFYEYMVDISNSFIDFYNKYLRKKGDRFNRCLTNNLLKKAMTKNGKFYEVTNRTYPDYSAYIGRLVLRFKEKNIYTSIIDSDEDDARNASTILLLSRSTAMYILKNILRTINFRYKNEYNNKQGDPKTSTADKRVFYI